MTAEQAHASTTTRGWSSSRVLLRLAVAIVGALFAVPFAYLVVRNLASGADFLGLATSSDTLGPLLRSVTLGVTVTTGATVLGTAGAWLVTRTDVPGRGAFRVLLALPLVLPSFVGAFALVAALAPGGLVEGLTGIRAPRFRGLGAATLVLTLLTAPYVFLPTSARLRQLPASLEEAGRVQGLGAVATFGRVVLPQVRGAIASGAMLVFLYVVSDFGAVQLLGYDTLTRAIYATRLFDRPTSLALTLQLGLLAVALVVVERRARRDLTRRTTTTTVAPLVHRLRPAGRVAALTGLVTVTFGSLLLPLAVLAWWLARGIRNGTLVLAEGLAEVGGALGGTAAVAVAAAVVAVIVLLPVGWASVRQRGPVVEAANAMVVGGFALPGLAIALALIAATVGSDLVGWSYQTLPLLVFAYVVNFGAQALRSTEVAVASIPASLDDAATTLGVRGRRRFWRVDLPLLQPGLLAGAGLVLLSTLKELPATLLLSPPGFETLAVQVWDASEDAFLAEASLGALTLVALSGLLTWLLVVRPSSR